MTTAQMTGPMVLERGSGRRTAWIVFGQSSVRICQIFIVLLLVRSLSPETWNVVALIFTIHLVAITIGTFNLEHSILYFLPTLDHKDQNGLLSRSSAALFVVGLCLGLLVAVGASYLSVFDNSTVALLLGIAIAAELPTVIAGPILISRQQEKDAATWDLFTSVMQMVLVVIPAFVFSSGVSVVAGLALGSLLRWFAFVSYFRDVIFRQTSNFNRDLLKRQLIFCAPLGVAMATGVLTRTIDKWIVAIKIPESVGIYVVAAQEVPVLSVLPYASGAVVAGSMVKKFSSGDFSSSFLLWKQQTRRMCFPVAALTFVVVVTAPEVFQFVFDVNRPDAVLCFQIFSLIGLHRVTEYGAVLRAVGKTSEVVLSSVVLLVLNFALGTIGIYVDGIVGLTIGSFFAFMFSWVWILLRLGKVFKVSIREVFPWAHWFLCVTTFGCASLFGFLCARVVENDVMRLAIKVFAVGFVVVVATATSRRLVSGSDEKVVAGGVYAGG